MDMYYDLWCPRCDKPPIKTLEYINLIKMLVYLEVKKPGIRKRVWDSISESIWGNDTTVFLNFGEEMQDCISGNLKEDYELIIKEYPEAEDGMMFEVSW